MKTKEEKYKKEALSRSEPTKIIFWAFVLIGVFFFSLPYLSQIALSVRQMHLGQ
jgi:capsule polysaccharide export protein KpsE/RkpR